MSAANHLCAENVRTNAAVERLVDIEGHLVSRAVVQSNDWQQAEDGSKTPEMTLAPEGAEGDG